MREMRANVGAGRVEPMGGNFRSCSPFHHHHNHIVIVTIIIIVIIQYVTIIMVIIIIMIFSQQESPGKGGKRCVGKLLASGSEGDQRVL